MYQPLHSKIRTILNSVQLFMQRNLILIALAIGCCGLSLTVRAVTPAPDGGYAGFNTAEGTNALFSLTTGLFNTAIGGQALKLDTTGSSNTAVGVNALVLTTTGQENTAVGQGALGNNATGIRNTAVGLQALGHNTTSGNTAVGYQALLANTTGTSNNAIGFRALSLNTTSSFQNAHGTNALVRATGGLNNAFGDNALANVTTGTQNTAFGDLAGLSLTTGNGNVCIGASVFGVAGETNITRIRNINLTPNNTGMFVEVDNQGKLGFVTSSRRYKHDIEAMDKESEVLFSFKPVTYHYNGDINPSHGKVFGLIAEDVAKACPDLAVRNAQGEIEAFRTDSVNAMLLNEFLKEHRRVQDLKETVAKQEKEIRSLAVTLKEATAQIQKVNARLDANKPAPRMVANQ